MRLVVGITGCTGVDYGVRLLEVCGKREIETDLIISPAAEKILKLESDAERCDLEEMATRSYDYDNLGAPISSGSVETDGMVIVPCSMKSIGAMANGVSDNLITRTADVTLKEERKLVLVPRETPLNRIHLDNLAKLSRSGGTVLPAAPGFYHSPEGINDLIDFIVGKILERFNIDHQLYQSWSGFREDEQS